MGLQDRQGVVTRLSELSAVSMGKLSLSPGLHLPAGRTVPYKALV